MRLSEKAMRIINLYHKYPEWQFHEIVEAVYGAGEADDISLKVSFPFVATTENLKVARRWRRESQERGRNTVRTLYKSKYSRETYQEKRRPWRSYEEENFISTIREFDREEYLREKWRGTDRLRYVKGVIGKHLMRVCRSQEDSCFFKALLPETEIQDSPA